jgi:hypothetical protein
MIGVRAVSLPSFSASVTEVTVPLLRRGSLTAPARRNTIAADQGGHVDGEDRLSRSPGGSGFGLDWDGAFVDFDAEADFNHLLEVVEPPKRRREPELVIPSPVLGAS